MGTFVRGILGLSAASLTAFAFTNCDNFGNSGFHSAEIPNSVSTLLKLKSDRVDDTNSVSLKIDIDPTLTASPSEITLSSSGGTFGSLQPSGDHQYSVVFTPSVTSALVEISATFRGNTYKKEILVLPHVHSRWGQPEPVPGLVNTMGWEDSPEVSPDGEWLLVSTYSPVSYVCCLGGEALNTLFGQMVCEGSTPSSTKTTPSCNRSRGPYGSPQRPSMLGVERILSPTSMNHDVAALNVVGENYAIPPTAAYGFKRQADGSFGAPFVFGMDWEGYSWGAPFGTTFLPGETGNSRKVLFTFMDPTSPTGSTIYQATLNSESANILGRFRYESGAVQRRHFQLNRLTIASSSNTQGNPQYRDQVLYWDDESAAEKDLYFAVQVGHLSALTFGTERKVAISQTNRGEYQPYRDDDRLLYSVDHLTITSARHLGGPMEQVNSWSAEQTELAVDFMAAQNIHGISNIGEPSIAIDSFGTKWLYFAYSVRRSFGIELNIGRVPLRP